MRRRTWVGAIVLGVVAAACSGDTAAPDGGTDAAVPEMDAASAAGCGDGVRQRPEEACDDGNTEDGDGCSADCTSDETCGNSVLDLGTGELCDDGNTDDGDDCRGDCLSDYRCGNDVQDLVADGAPADEVCDDGNTTGGDGCGAACDSDESCGNNIVDVIAGEVCDDGNTDDGDDCSADCSVSLLCGNGTMEGAEECDDGDTDDGDGCSASCLVERCGNGRVDAGEACDDGNTDDADGCTAACAFTCSADADCADAEPCNGEETCMNAGTATSQCAAGTPLTDGASCGTDLVCTSGICAAAGCGDGVVTAPEDCDDSNLVNGDGCDADCTWTCAGAADCDDGNPCNGVETCAMPSTIMSACAAGTAPAEGTACDRDATPATRDICLTNVCAASSCGDAFADPGATPPEQCDDGNTLSGDGCSATCQTESAVMPTGFRITNLDLISPRVVYNVPFVGCRDLTETPTDIPFVGSFSVNSSLQGEIDSYALNLVHVFRPLSPAAAMTASEQHMNADCTAGSSMSVCTPAAAPDVIMTTAMNQSAGTCFTPVAADVNTRAGTPAMYVPAAHAASGPCFASAETNLTVTFDVSGESLVVPLQRARIAATYSGTPTDTLISGMITGFVTNEAAADASVSLPVVGTVRLYQMLQAGNRSTTDSGGASFDDTTCNLGGGAMEDDGDSLTAGGSSRDGFWFFLNFEAELVDWTDP